MRALSVAHAIHGEVLPDWTTKDAWEQLHREAVARPIRTIGNPVERFDDGAGGVRETKQVEQEIPDIQLEALTPLAVGDDEYLIHGDFRISRGSDWRNVRGYSDVRFRVTEVLAAFPVGSDPKTAAVDSQPQQAAEESSQKPAPKLEGRGNTSRAVAAAIEDLFPNGVPPGTTSGDRNNRIFEWLDARGIKRFPNRKTIEREIAKRRK